MTAMFHDQARFIFALLNQGEVWFPKGKPPVPIVDMDPEWRYNASRLLERQAGDLVMSYTFGELLALSRAAGRDEVLDDQDTPHMIGPMLSWLDLASDSALDGLDEWHDQNFDDPLNWLRGTKLHQALVADLPDDPVEFGRLADRAGHWSTCPARVGSGLVDSRMCRCDEIRSAHENTEQIQ